LYWQAGETTLSDQPLSNIDWKLNKLLSADRESRQYALKTPEDKADLTVEFEPWEPRRLALDAAPDTLQDDPDDHEPALDESDLIHDEQPAAAQTVEQSAEESQETLSQAELESVRKTAFNAGYQQARQQLQAQIQTQEQALEDLVNSLNQQQIDVQGQHTALVNLAVFVAEQALRAELIHSPHFINDLAELCIKEIRRHGNDRISIRISLQDFELTQALQASHSESIDFIKDKSLQPGDLKLAMGYTEIDETMRHKLQTLTNALLTEQQQLPSTDVIVAAEVAPL
jgi:flagellar biosynthesis/type III secretory pathway protein FliH